MSIGLKLARTEPFRTLYTTHRISSLIIKLPFRLLYYIRLANRPRASWTIMKAVMVSVIRDITDLIYITGRFGGRDVTKEVAAKDCKGAHFLWIEALPSGLVAGQLKQFVAATSAKSVRIPAYGFGQWGSPSSSLPLAADGEKIVMHLHGGGYVIGTAHPEDTTAGVSRALIEQGKGVISRTLSIDYRLATSAPYPATNPFPTALIDAIAGYVHLVQKLGFKPQNIIVAGDSAGGNLALALVRYLRDQPELGLGMPGGLILISPSTDPARTHREVAGKWKENFKTDYLKPSTDSPYSMGGYILSSMLGAISREAAATNPYIGPASLQLESSVLQGLFSGFPPTYVLAGEGEVLVDEIRTLEKRMRADLPEGDLVYDEVLDAIHDFVLFSFWEPERTETFKRIITWIGEL